MPASAAPAADATYTVSKAVYSFLAGGLGLPLAGSPKLTGTAHAGRGVFTLVLERRPEGWRIIHDHTSVSPEAVPPS